MPLCPPVLPCLRVRPPAYPLAIVSSLLYRCAVLGKHKEDRFAIFDSLRRRLARFRSNARGMLNLACSLGWIALLTSCKPFENLETFAVVLAVEGNATVAIRRDSAPQPVTLTTRLPPGSSVTTGATGKVVIRLLPGIHCAIGPDSNINLAELRFAKPGNDTSDPVDARSSQVALSRGTLTCSVTGREKEAVSKLSVNVATRTVIANDDSLFVVKNSSPQARAVCASGNLLIGGAPAGFTEIGPSSFYEWPTGGGPAQIHSLDTDPEARADAALALETASGMERFSSLDEDELPTR